MKNYSPRVLGLALLFLLIIPSLCAADDDDSQNIEMKKIMKWGFFPKENERGLTSYFPEVTFKLHNTGDRPTAIKKVIVTYLHSSNGEIIYVHRISLNKKMKPGEDVTIKSVSRYGFSEKQLFNLLADQEDPLAIGDTGNSIIALIQVNEMEGTNMGWQCSFRNKWLREGYRLKTKEE